MAPGLPRRSFSARPRSNERRRRNAVLLSGDRASESDEGTAPWWEPNQYVEDITSGNSTVPSSHPYASHRALQPIPAGKRTLSPRFCLIRGCKRYPFIEGKDTSGNTLLGRGLQPGEIVEVKSKEKIFATLDKNDETQGLRFDGEMLKYCGRRARVLRRIESLTRRPDGC